MPRGGGAGRGGAGTHYGERVVRGEKVPLLMKGARGAGGWGTDRTRRFGSTIFPSRHYMSLGSQDKTVQITSFTIRFER